MRHLHTPAGATNPDLTPEGQRYAQLLAARLQRDPPRVIYASATRRAQQTAAPLAQRLAITPKIYDPAETAALVRLLVRHRYDVRTTRPTVKEMARAFGRGGA